MASPSAPSNRASLLAGLRTGGVRSASQPLQVPHTAAPAGSFHIPRFVSANRSSNYFPEEDEDDDQLAELAAQNLSLHHNPRHSGIPMTASAADGAMMFQQQQLLLRQLGAQRPAPTGGMYQDQAEMQAQMVQMELLRLQIQQAQQAQQAQQYQAELYAQAQRQQAGSRGPVRLEPMTAAPSITTFDQRANAAAQLRARAQQAEYRAAMSNIVDDYAQVPMTAAIGGKFGSRGLNPHANSFVAGSYGQADQQADLFMQNNYMNVPPTPGRTTVISGGTSLGTPTAPTTPTISKSDAAVSWRRAGNNSVLRSASSPLNTRLTRSSPSNDESSPTAKSRPQPLKFNSIDSMTIPTVTIDTSNVDEDTSSSTSSKGGSPTSASGPATPPSNDASLVVESKKSYEGLGIGRQPPAAPTPRHVSMPMRQPKGPPSGADELGPRNFATRLRKQAIGGLGALVNARERREVPVEVQAF